MVLYMHIFLATLPWIWHNAHFLATLPRIWHYAHISGDAATDTALCTYFGNTATEMALCTYFWQCCHGYRIMHIFLATLPRKWHYAHISGNTATEVALCTYFWQCCHGYGIMHIFLATLPRIWHYAHISGNTSTDGKSNYISALRGQSCLLHCCSEFMRNISLFSGNCSKILYHFIFIKLIHIYFYVMNYITTFFNWIWITFVETGFVTKFKFN